MNATASDLLSAVSHAEYLPAMLAALADADHLELGRLVAEAVIAVQSEPDMPWSDPEDLGALDEAIGRLQQTYLDRVVAVPVRATP